MLSIEYIGPNQTSFRPSPSEVQVGRQGGELQHLVQPHHHRPGKMGYILNNDQASWGIYVSYNDQARWEIMYFRVRQILKNI